MILCEKIVNTKDYAGRLDIITGVENFETNVTYNEEFHTYELNGEILPSVTQLLDDSSFEFVDPKVLKYACDKGTLVHKEIQDFLEHQKIGFTSEFDEFLRIYAENKEKFQEKAIFDVKTYSQNSPAKREKCYFQIKMYDDGFNFLTGDRADNYYEIWLPHNKKGKLIDLKKEFEKGDKNE